MMAWCQKLLILVCQGLIKTHVLQGNVLEHGKRYVSRASIQISLTFYSLPFLSTMIMHQTVDFLAEDILLQNT